MNVQDTAPATITATPNRETVFVSGSRLIYLLIHVVANALMAIHIPTKFVLLLDTSGSMAGEGKIDAVREAVKAILRVISPLDYICVITFDDAANTLIPMQQITSDEQRQYWISFIDQTLDASYGGTNIDPGMKAALAALESVPVVGAVEQILLMTDGVYFSYPVRVAFGHPNYGLKVVQELASVAGTRGIKISPFSLGAPSVYKDLQDLAIRSGNTEPPEYLKGAGEVEKMFQESFFSATNVALRNVVLTVKFTSDITPKRATRVIPQISVLDEVLQDKVFRLPIGDLDANGCGVLLEFLVVQKPAGRYRIMEITLDFDTPSATGLQLKQDVFLSYATDSAEDALVMQFAERVNAARLVNRVIAEHKRTGKVTTRLSKNVTRLLDDETVTMLEQLQQGQSISSEQELVIGRKARKLTQMLDL